MIITVPEFYLFSPWFPPRDTAIIYIRLSFVAPLLKCCDGDPLACRKKMSFVPWSDPSARHPPKYPPYTHTSILSFPIYSYFLQNFPMTSWVMLLDRNIFPTSEHALFFMILLIYKRQWSLTSGCWIWRLSSCPVLKCPYIIAFSVLLPYSSLLHSSHAARQQAPLNRSTVAFSFQPQASRRTPVTYLVPHRCLLSKWKDGWMDGWIEIQKADTF